MRLRHYATSTALALLLASGAQAGTVDLTEVTAAWQNEAGGPIVSSSGQGTSNAEVRWGPNNPNSGYNFTAAASLPDVGIAPLTNFLIGTFTHYNNPINAGTSITGIELVLNYTLLIPSGGDPVHLSSTFYFDHNETTNTQSLCPGETPPCDDIVTISVLGGSNTNVIEIGDSTYFLDISFGDTHVVKTVEGTSNPVNLYGKFRLETDLPVIPLPAAGFLLLGALGGLGLVGRRRRKAA